MSYKGKSEFLKIGLLTLVLGVVIVIVGSLGIREFWLSSIYPSDLYWHLTLNIVGSGLILAGIIIAIVGRLRTEEVGLR